MTRRVWTGVAFPITLLSGMLLLIAVGSAWYIRDMQKSVAGMLADNVASVRAAQELEISVRDLRSQVARYLISGETKFLEPVPRLRDRVTKALATAEALAYTPPEQALMRKTRAGLGRFFGEYDHMTQGNPRRAEYTKTLELIDSVLAAEVLDPTREYLRLNEGALAKANEENRMLANRLTAGLVGLGLCGAGGGVLAGWVIAAGMRRSEQRAEERLRTTARQLDEAARTAAVAASRGGKTVDALDDVTKSATAVLSRLRRTEHDALRAEQLAWAGQMAAGIAHEVRNPLMSIKLLIQALATGSGPDRLRPEHVRILEEEIIRLEQIISSFLDFARPPRPDKRLVEVGPLVEQVAAGVRGRAGLQGVGVEVETPPAAAVTSADPNQLRQVLYNLAFNALDAQPDGGLLRMSVEADGAGLVIRVEDAGPGLPAHLRDQIFDPFVSTKESGMGLGLSICRRIAESHGGEIRAADRAGGGAVFELRLPAAAGALIPVPSRNGH